MKRLFIILSFLLLCIVVGGGWFVNRELKDFFALSPNNNNADIADPNAWQFAVIGDTEDLRPITETILADISQRDLEFVVHVGDISSHSDPVQLTAVKNAFAELPFPTYYVPGNNDLVYDDALEIKTLKNYTDIINNETYASFDLNNAHFILLDNSYLRYGFPDEELVWLENDLAQNTKPFTFLFFHRPLDVPGQQIFGDDETPNSRIQNEKFKALIAQYDITRIFNGHIHTALGYTLGTTAIPVTVTGGGGALPQEFLGGEDAAFFHYLVVTVGADGTKPVIDRVEFE
jgi:hypothetical protein